MCELCSLFIILSHDIFILKVRKLVFILLIKSEDILNTIGKKIKKARIAKNYTQEALAEQIDISTDLLRNIENARNIGSLPTLLNLCNALEITPDFLFSNLISTHNKNYDKDLLNLIDKLSISDKNILKQIINYLEKKYA